MMTESATHRSTRACRHMQRRTMMIFAIQDLTADFLPGEADETDQRTIMEDDVATLEETDAVVPDHQGDILLDQNGCTEDLL